MIKQISRKSEAGYDWIDVTEPTGEELRDLILRFELHPGLLDDCKDVDLLPKYEKIDDYYLVIFRIGIENDAPEADSMHELTDTIFIIYSRDFLISLCYKRHLLSEPLFKSILTKRVAGTHQVLNLLIRACLHTYVAMLNKVSAAADYFEKDIFLAPNKVPVLKGLYYLKRKADLFVRIIRLSEDVINFIYLQEENMDTRDTKDQYIKLQNSFDGSSENIHQLLNIYFSVSSQRTNDTMRVLTIFSVFFLPLSFIVGVYGMNFKNIPELGWRYGYPGAIGLMGVMTLLIYLWFRKKRWL